MDVGAESRREVVGEDFDDAAEGVPGLLRRVDLGDHPGGEGGVEAADGIPIEGVDIARPRQRTVPGVLDAADRHGVGDERDAEFAEELRGHGAQRHAHRRLAGRGAFEDGPGLVEAVLLHADDVGVAGPGSGERGAAGLTLELGLVDGVGAHHRLPFRPFGVADLDRHRGAEGLRMADAAEDAHFVGLELHAGATPVAESAPGEIDADVVPGDRDVGGQPLNDPDQCFAVGFACSQPSQHSTDSIERTSPRPTRPTIRSASRDRTRSSSGAGCPHARRRRSPRPLRRAW